MSKYSVGYKHPPRHTQFQKGRSGNPRGRPKASPNLLTMLVKIANELVTIVENGKRKKISKVKAALKQLVNKAAAGDLKALKTMSEMLGQAGATEPTADFPRTVVILPSNGREKPEQLATPEEIEFVKKLRAKKTNEG